MDAKATLSFAEIQVSDIPKELLDYRDCIEQILNANIEIKKQLEIFQQYSQSNDCVFDIDTYLNEKELFKAFYVDIVESLNTYLSNRVLLSRQVPPYMIDKKILGQFVLNNIAFTFDETENAIFMSDYIDVEDEFKEIFKNIFITTDADGVEQTMCVSSKDIEAYINGLELYNVIKKNGYCYKLQIHDDNTILYEYDSNAKAYKAVENYVLKKDHVVKIFQSLFESSMFPLDKDVCEYSYCENHQIYYNLIVSISEFLNKFVPQFKSTKTNFETLIKSAVNCGLSAEKDNLLKLQYKLNESMDAIISNSSAIAIETVNDKVYHNIVDFNMREFNLNIIKQHLGVFKTISQNFEEKIKILTRAKNTMPVIHRRSSANRNTVSYRSNLN